MDAYNYLKNNEVDLLLTDVKMPLMDGVELIRRLKAEDSDIVCVVLSGYNDFEYVRPCLQNNVFGYLLKPLDKARPWMLWPYIGCAIALVACFAIPTSWGETAQ